MQTLIKSQLNNENEHFYLDYPAFIRSIKINLESSYSFFLGAGASISSGMPSAENCIWDWKKELFITTFPDKKEHYNEISLPGVKQKIQEWLDNQNNYPPKDSPEEYSYYIQKAFPINQDRNKYFQSYISKVEPNVGYKLLSILAESGLVKSIWTTNFDNLVEKAIYSETKLNLIKVESSTLGRLNNNLGKNDLLYVSLHGDYRYDLLRNTAEELKQLEFESIKSLKEHLKTNNLIVAGYSGRDDSIMQALKEAYNQEGTGRLYWCGYGNEEPNGRIKELLLTAYQNNREAYFVQTGGFDDLLYNLSVHCLNDDHKIKAETINKVYSDEMRKKSSPFEINSNKVTTLIKSNMYEISCPAEAFQFESEYFFKDGNTWKKINECIGNNKNVVAVTQNKKIISMGLLNEIRSIFGDKISSNIDRIPIDPNEISYNGAINNLYKKAVIGTIAKSKDLHSNFDSLLWKKEFYVDREYRVHDAILVNLKSFKNCHYLVISPTIYITDGQNNKVSFEVEKEFKRKILTGQRNEQFNEKLKEWGIILFENKKEVIFEFPCDSNSDFKFKVTGIPILAEICQENKRIIHIDNKFKKFVKYKGTQIEEPALLFKDKSQNIIKDINPIRGLSANLPYDYGINPGEIKIGVICPQNYSKKLYDFLNLFHSKQNKITSDDYILDFPGFSSALNLGINIPGIQDDNWIQISDIPENSSISDGVHKLKEVLKNGINELKAKRNNDLTIIFIPKSWSKWEKYKDRDEDFDLHNFIKAYCVQKGVFTQFLREGKLDEKDKCRLFWFLSLSLYIKSHRIPWLLDNMDTETAFIGVGYSIDHSKNKNNKILLGCSHLYNYKGTNLGYDLSKIENPKIIQKNPHLSKEDAYSFGVNSLEIFNKTMSRLPNRVVIHKKTRFTSEEKEGFLQALKGVKNIDMIEINEDSAIRFLSSYVKDGKFNPGKFPVNRGTVVLLGYNKFLLWNHGSVNLIPNDYRSYYQGGRRIPAPLLVTRHCGNTDLNTIAKEIMGLSKMNLNSFDLYSKFPATIDSSNKIAQIGKLLERTNQNFDYRLFI